MPQTEVVFYQEAPQDVPVLDWMGTLRHTDRRGYAKCVARVQLLAEIGHELRRPQADFLRDRIHELRVRRGRVNYRILYFFLGTNVAVLACGLSKEAEVPEADIERAVRRKVKFEKDPEKHTFAMELGNDG